MRWPSKGGGACVTQHLPACSVTSVLSDSLQPYGLYPARLLCPWDFPGKNPGVGHHFLLQGIFLTQGLKPCLLFGKEILYHRATWEAQEQRLGIAIIVISVAGIP